ncbi:MAG TPA: hypothetical protein DC058_10745 [Planctomycetaceae bacterium]|nr:hypothetical protein [Planctomycetaceae bacterium]HBC61682.1 hypothetical protein [Planctomycetaceae bacterium]
MPILTSEHPNERGLPLLAERGWDDQQDAAFPFGPALGENARGAGVARQEPRRPEGEVWFRGSHER